MNELLHIFLLFMGTLGATFIVNFSYLFRPIREKVGSKSEMLGKLLGCPQCLGFWFGILLESIFMIKMGAWSTIQLGDVYHIFYGFATSIFCYITYLLIKPLKDKYD